MDITYEIKISTPRRKDFDVIVKAMKFIGAKFDPAAKTWTATIEAVESEHYAPEIAAIKAAGFHDANFYATDMTITEVGS